MQRLRRELSHHRILDPESAPQIIILYSSLHTFHIKVAALCLKEKKKKVFLQLNKYVCLKEETQGVFTQGNFHLDELLALPGLTFPLEVLFTLTENALFTFIGVLRVSWAFSDFCKY